MIAFILIALGLLGFVGFVVFLVAKGIRTDSWRYDSDHVWKDFDDTNYRDN